MNKFSQLILTAETLVKYWEQHQELPQSREIEEIKGGSGKKTYHIIKNSLSIALQIRPHQPFYEPVVEAHSYWSSKNSVPVPKLLGWGSITGHQYYIFSWVDGIQAKRYIQKLVPENKKKVLMDIGAAFASLCKIPSTKFGGYRKKLIGKETTWKDFVIGRFHENIESALNKNIIYSKLAAHLHNHNLILKTTSLECHYPKLLYIDINLTNVIMESSTYNPIIIDHDYLVSGDPAWVLARLSVLFDEKNDAQYIMKGFQQVLNIGKSKYHQYFRIIHSLELSLLPINQGEQTLKRRKRLIKIIKQDPSF